MKINKFLFPVLLLGCGVAACGPTTDGKTLNIICINASFGSAWIEELKTVFETQNPDVKVELKAVYESQQLINQHLASSKNKDDLYISVGNYKTPAAQNKFLALDDLLEETVDGVKVKDKISSEYSDSIYFTKSNGSKECYRLPFTSGVGGIFYNAKMFADNGWEVPTTYAELMTLCDTINSATIPVAGDPDGITAVKPLIYAGTDTDYFDYTVFDWWGQLAGIDNVKEFLKYESADNFDYTKNETYAHLKTATEKWRDLFVSKNVVPNTNNMKAADAQKQFINGYSAMMFNGDWLYNDSLSYTQSGNFDDTFKLALMKTPTIADGVENNISYIIGEDQYIAIPKTAPNADLAKEFIKLIISNQGCQIFAEKAHGFLAYKSTYSTFEDEFMNDLVALRNSYTTKFTNFSNDRKYLCGYVDIWFNGASRPYLNVLQGTTTVDAAFVNIASSASAQWSYITQQSK